MGSLERTDVYMILSCGMDRRVIKAVGIGDLERFSSLVQMSITQFISVHPHFIVQEHYARMKEECAHRDMREKRGRGCVHARKIARSF